MPPEPIDTMYVACEGTITAMDRVFSPLLGPLTAEEKKLASMESYTDVSYIITVFGWVIAYAYVTAVGLY